MGEDIPLWTAVSDEVFAAAEAHMTGRAPPKALEFRPDEKGRFDEIVARFADGMVHVETLSDNSCYVGFYWDDGRFCQWWISSKKRLRYYHEDGLGDPPKFPASGMSPGTAETGTGSGPKDGQPDPKGDAQRTPEG